MGRRKVEGSHVAAWSPSSPGGRGKARRGQSQVGNQSRNLLGRGEMVPEPPPQDDSEDPQAKRAGEMVPEPPPQ